CRLGQLPDLAGGKRRRQFGVTARADKLPAAPPRSRMAAGAAFESRLSRLRSSLKGLPQKRRTSDSRLGDLQVFRLRLAAIFHEVILHDLIFIEGGEPGTLDSGDVDEDVLLADLRLDEAITLGRVEPFDGTPGHRLSPALDTKKTRQRLMRA